MEQHGELGELEAALSADPTNLDLGWRYWNALGEWKGCDIRSGGYVLHAFRAAALKSPAGVLAFARAYQELFNQSGEGPLGLDHELRRAVESSLPALRTDERTVVEWLLNFMEQRQHRA